MDLLTFIAVFILAFAVMFVGVLSGGVGLVTRPILILLGYPPQIVIGTSRASGILGELPGIIVLQKSKKADKPQILFLSIPILLGTLLATAFIITAENHILKMMIGIIVLATALFLLVSKNFGEVETKPIFSRVVRAIIAFFGTLTIAFLGIISGGLGSLYTLLYTWLYGKTYIGASSLWRVAGYFGGLVASVIFILKGIIDWQLFIVLTAGFMFGSYFGTHFSLWKGEKWTRYFVIIVAIASAIKLLFG